MHSRNQSGQTKLGICVIIGSYQCCTLNIEIWDCNECGFFGHLLVEHRKIFVASLITSQNKAIGFCFFPYPAATMPVILVRRYGMYRIKKAI